MEKETIAKLALCEAMESIFGRDLYDYMEQATEENGEFCEWQDSLSDKNGDIQTKIKEQTKVFLDAYNNYVNK